MAIVDFLVHRRIRKIIEVFESADNTSSKLPTIIIKLKNFSTAICRFFYLHACLEFLFLFMVLYISLLAPYLPCAVVPGGTEHPHIPSFLTVLLTELELLPMFITWCIVLEGRPKPSFPCQAFQTNLPDLHPSKKLGTALLVMAKHGLKFQKRRENPVQTTVRVLTDRTPLMVQSAPAMSLMECVDHMGEYLSSIQSSIGKVLRSVKTELNVELRRFDFPHLTLKTRKSLEWAHDPDRQTLGNGDMTPDEAAAIMLYTQETCLYRLLNAALRDHCNPHRLTPFLPYLKLLLTALYKLPLVEAKVYRGVKLDLHDAYDTLVGKRFTWWAFSSTTPNRKALLCPTFLGSSGPRTLFCIDAIGVDISQFSAFPMEMEILLLPGINLELQPGKLKDGIWEYNGTVLREEPSKASKAPKIKKECCSNRAKRKGVLSLPTSVSRSRSASVSTVSTQIIRALRADIIPVTSKATYSLEDILAEERASTESTEFCQQCIDFAHPGWIDFIQENIFEFLVRSDSSDYIFM